MPIHEKSLIRPENLESHEELVLDDVDVSGHWSTFISPRVVTDYNESLEDEIAALPGGENIHRCWQCGSCTNACTVNAVNPDFNPRFWIYLVRMGMEEELLRDKEIIWQCVSCHKCTTVCPRDVEPEGVMKAMAHWLELKGHQATSPSSHFDEVFSEQVIETGKIEEGRIIRDFFRRTGQPLMQDWLVEMVKRLSPPPAGHAARADGPGKPGPAAHQVLGPGARGDPRLCGGASRPASARPWGWPARQDSTNPGLPEAAE